MSHRTTCEECRYSSYINHTHGECRFSPPVNGQEGYARFPVVKHNHWCGQAKQKNSHN